MKLFNRSLVIICLIAFCLPAFSQKNKNKWPEISSSDFEPVVYSIDSNAEAVVLFDGGSAKYQTDGESWFEVVYTYRKRVRLMNKNAFSLATIEIPLYKNNSKEDKIDNLKACTYTSEKGTIIKTNLDKNSLFTDKADKDITIKKFTFPNLQEGCIIEYSYSVISPRSYSMRGWFFQSAYPVLHSEYEVKVPVLFDYIFLNSGSYIRPPDVEYTTESYSLVFRTATSYGLGTSTDQVSYKATNVNTKWSLDNLPAMKKENYTTTTRNYISKIEFQLKSINYPNRDPEPFMNTWFQADSLLMADEQFGRDLTKDNDEMDRDLKTLVVGDSLQSAKNIYAFVKDNFICTDHDAVYMEENLRNTYRAKKGNVSAVNLVLSSMLLKAGFRTDPILLSTRENGFPYELYPLLNKFNYVIAKLRIGESEYLLDATRKKLGFNRLPDYCYNGTGRTISPMPVLVNLSADSITEEKNTQINIVNSKDNKSMTGAFRSVPGYFESYDTREEISASGIDAYFKKLKNKHSTDLLLTNSRIDSLNDTEKTISVKYDFSFAFNDDMVYFNPIMSEGIGKNPFTAAAREYPVEMPSRLNENYVLTMEIPAGYVVEELPRSTRVTLNETGGKFEYVIRTDGRQITLKCTLQLNKANYDAAEYPDLREFYKYVEKKENEPVVFKKTN